MTILLVPGLWLDGSSWQSVIPGLEQAGHRAVPITLPGMHSKDAERASVTLADRVRAVVAAIDAADGEVVVVGYSAGAGIAWAAVDARPDRVSRAILVGGFPTEDGAAIADGFPAQNGEVPFPDWAVFEDADLAGLDDAARDRFRERALPSPEQVVCGVQRLADERRYRVPVTAICTEYTSRMLREWIANDLAPVHEFPKIRDVNYVDLTTGHWPQFTRPGDLATAILIAIHAPANRAIDDQGRPEPPLDGDEIANLLGFLEYQRATLAWKCRGLDSGGLQATTAASSMTLGGMLKHLAYVEQSWFSGSLHGHDRQPPFDTVDWAADRDWDWHSAADDSAEELFRTWTDAVVRARAMVGEALRAGGLEQRAKRTWPDGSAPSLRWILAHMIEEYARHNGHADLLRESVDGQTGE